MSKHEELADILQQHRRWLESGRSSGRRADLSGARLDESDLSGADLRGALLAGASLRKADLRDASLIHADLSDADLRGALLQRANLILADFSRADLREANLSETTPSLEDSPGQVRRGPRFDDADLTDADLQRAYCYISDFSGARLAGANLSGAHLRRANLSHNTLVGVDLDSADLQQADCRGTDLSDANLQRVRMAHANLEQARLTGADISGADLRSANLADAQVDGIRYNRCTRFRGIRVNSCFGSARFRRFAQDQDYIEEFREAHPVYFYSWLWLTDCGRSLALVFAWCLAFALLFGLLYFSLGESAFAVSHSETMRWNIFTAIYYSVVTFTTLGFGDITPRTPVAAAAVMVEVVVGYLMLGILISILANKVARRS